MSPDQAKKIRAANCEKYADLAYLPESLPAYATLITACEAEADYWRLLDSGCSDEKKIYAALGKWEACELLRDFEWAES